MPTASLDKTTNTVLVAHPEALIRYLIRSDCMKDVVRIHLGLTFSDQFESDLLQSAMIAMETSQFPFLLVALQKKKDIRKSSDNYQ